MMQQNLKELLEIQQNNSKLILSLIGVVNTAVDQENLDKIQEEFEQGYIYVNVKKHKPNNPLRPIISQFPTPIYKLAKELNRLIFPFIPSAYSLKSIDYFISTLRITKAYGY